MSDADPRDDKLRDALATLAEQSPTSTDCPSPDELWAAQRRELDPESIRNIIDHTATCPACAEDWRLARGLRASAALSDDDVRPEPNVSFWTWAGVAASIAIAVAAVMFSGPDTTTRTGAGDSDSIQSLVLDGAALPREEFRLEWTPGPDEAVYRLHVITESLEEVIVVDGLSESTYVIPEEALRSLASGTVLLWRVEMTLPDGRRVSSPSYGAAIE